VRRYPREVPATFPASDLAEYACPFHEIPVAFFERSLPARKELRWHDSLDHPNRARNRDGTTLCPVKADGGVANIRQSGPGQGLRNISRPKGSAVTMPLSGPGLPHRSAAPKPKISPR